MSITDLYFASFREGTVSGSANALGAPDGTYTTDTGNTNWVSSWFLEEFTDGTKDELTGTQLFTATIRKDSVLGNDPTLSSVTLFIKTGASTWTSHQLVGETVVTDLISEVSGSVDASVFSSAVNMTEHYIEFNASGSGGPPNSRRTIQLDAVNWDAQWEESTPTGDLDATMGGLTASMGADAVTEGSLGSTLGPLQSSFDAETSEAQLGSTLGPLQGAFDADAITEAAITSTLASLQGSFEADHGDDNTANLDATLGSLQASFDGEQNEADVASSLGALRGAFDADAITEAEIASTLSALQASFDADHGDDNNAQLDANLGSLQSSSEGSSNEADASPALGSLQGSFDADAQVEADSDPALSGLQGSFAANHGDDTTAQLDATLGPLQGSLDLDANAEVQLGGSLGSLQSLLDVAAFLDVVKDSSLASMSGGLNSVLNGGPVGGGLASLTCTFQAERLDLVKYNLPLAKTTLDKCSVITSVPAVAVVSAHPDLNTNTNSEG